MQVALRHGSYSFTRKIRSLASCVKRNSAGRPDGPSESNPSWLLSLPQQPDLSNLKTVTSKDGTPFLTIKEEPRSNFHMICLDTCHLPTCSCAKKNPNTEFSSCGRSTAESLVYETMTALAYTKLGLIDIAADHNGRRWQRVVRLLQIPTRQGLPALFPILIHADHGAAISGENTP
ncbi:predicted protein [Histoplasma capsulatum H143]|uniref:Uncharacterized protein n=1 Tax=Ajellomyces capsulatus (strain H143) TaxID=544712 RepID=C6HQV5_AJECH|nr:predicted protein [Histoplasma capsulatum H143]